MSLRVTTSGSIPAAVWDDQAMTAAANLVRSLIVVRTFNDHLGDDDRPMKAYSTRPLKLYYRTGTARRLKPKGGSGFPWVRGPRLPGGGYDASKIGQEGGRYYGGGYAEYKRASTRGGGAVDLTLSGQLAREFRVIQVQRTHAIIGLTGQAKIYGPHVDAARPWMDLSPAGVRELEEHLPGIVVSVMGRHP
jgi:hypothetical protein